jgi:hypothetical protein
MPFAIMFVGLILLITGVRGTVTPLGGQLQKDFTGSQSFVMWALAIVLVGFAGYVPELRRLSHWFLALIVLSMVLANGRNGLFAKFMAQIKAGPSASPGGAAIGPSGSSESAISNALVGAASEGWKSPAGAGTGWQPWCAEPNTFLSGVMPTCTK